MNIDETIKWSTQEYEYKEKNTNWYVALIIIMVSASVASFVLGNVLFSILIVVGVLTLVMYSKREPKIINVELGKRGILIDSNVYTYNILESFWIEEYEKEPRIIIQSEKALMPYIIIPLGDANPEEVRDFLLEYLDEKKHAESVLYKFMEYLGF